MTGSALALPLLSAGGAHAADTATWDRVAQCESGGIWSSDTGNGFYGGLQLTQDMWDRHGGAAYASRPDLASRAQQIAVAETILDDLGPDAWPSCAVNAGLKKDGRAPQVDPGGTSTPIPDPSDDDGTAGSGSSGWHDGTADDPGGDDRDGPAGDKPSKATPSPSTPAPSDSAGTGTSPDPDRTSGSSGQSGDATPGDRGEDPSGTTAPSDDGTSGSDASGTGDGPGRGKGDDTASGGSRGGTATDGVPGGKGRHRGDADQGEGEGDGGDRASGGRHASRGDDAHRTPPAEGDGYTVQPGDSLSAIARAHRLPGGWPALYDRNEDVVGSDADLIQPGQQLDLGRSAG
ncbi:transglycosylase family protein [Streptomyces endophytica]|uniref:transglycosylase family protein n=1 Tax=Streptomyces endophytica TaxID=2991496 RepID=UPI0024357468|nr:transglycosylase family protein [Streptomyces endophytica]